MFSNLPVSQEPQAKLAHTSPFFMFLDDQYKTIKTQNPDIKLEDLAANALKEWDAVASIREEYAAKFLEESEKNGFLAPSNNAQTTILSQPEEMLRSAVANQKPQPPIKPLSALKYYQENCIERVKGENPDRDMVQITFMIADMWANEHQDVRSLYESQEKTAQEAYRREIADYEAKYGKIIEITPADIALARRIRAQRF